MGNMLYFFSWGVLIHYNPDILTGWLVYNLICWKSWFYYLWNTVMKGFSVFKWWINVNLSCARLLGLDWSGRNLGIFRWSRKQSRARIKNKKGILNYDINIKLLKGNGGNSGRG